jgi:hypothetical protein
VKTIRNTATVLFLLSLVVVLALAYGTRSGRRAVRQVSRVVRLARNATHIYPQPVLMLRIWSGAGKVAFRVQVFESGRLVVTGRESAERQLPDDTTTLLLEAGQEALADFNNDGCNVANGDRNAELYLMIDGQWMGTLCRNAVDWPRGAKTRRLLDEINHQLPDAMKLPVEF